MAKEKNETTYFSERMRQLGISDTWNKFETPNYKGRWKEGNPEEVNKHEVFEADDEDNIRIHYFNLFGNHYSWRKEGTKMPKWFYRTRLKEPKGDMKYSQAKGSGISPFFTPGIIKKYHDEAEIDTLILTEGEFKAFKGYMNGLDIVGLPSIHGFYNGDVKGKLHEDLQELLIKCKVKKIYFLTDADSLSVRWEKDKDLSKRPLSFYTAVKYFRESLELLLNDDKVALQNVYWGHIETKYASEEEGAKGLDDLLIKHEKKVRDIIEDLKSFQFARKYFRSFIITDGQINKIYRYFGLGGSTEFYNTYKAFIGNREFLYKKRRYQFDGEDVKYVRHEDADKYMRIGPDWMKIIHVPNKHGVLDQEIIPWKKSEITMDYKKWPDFMDQIPKYDAFCNEPSWNGDYKRVHNSCLKLCEPMTHEPKEGEFPTIREFLKHIFSGEGDFNKDIESDQFTVGLDYLCIQMQHPKQMLPVPILVSPENKTGKSTFFKWLQAVYGNNACILTNELFKMNFNAHYINKFIIAIDEGFLEIDKKAEKERLKQLATSDTAFLENKGMNVKKFPYYGKLMIGSNDADRVMKIEDGENRWFVVRVHPLQKEDPDFEQKMANEIPAWIHYAMHRPIFHKRESRLWFNEKHFITDQFRIVVEETKNRIDRLIEDYVKDLFLTYQIKEIRVGLKTFVQKINEEGTKYRIDREDIRTYFKKKKGLEPHRHPIKQNFPIGFTEDLMESVQYIESKQRCFHLYYKEWLTEEEIISDDGKGIEFEDTTISKKDPSDASSQKYHTDPRKNLIKPEQQKMAFAQGRKWEGQNNSNKDATSRDVPL
jgi:hypothetical protein